MSSAIPQDAPNESLNTTEDVVEALLEGWKEPDGDGLSDDTDEDTTDETQTDEDEGSDDSDESPESDESDEDEGDESEDESDDSDEEDEEADKKPKTLKDKDIVKVSVDGKEIDVPVEKLKRLYGQEAALTRKSQEAATIRKKAEEAGARHVAATETLLQRAQERYKPYEGIDWLVAAQQLDAEELTALRGEAQKAYSDIQYLNSELDGFMHQAYQTRQADMIEEARTTLKNLQDPKTGIPGFSEKLYDEMRVFAINRGVPQEIVNNIVSEPMIRILHQAMQFERGKKALVKPKSKTAPKTILKGKANPEATRKVISKSKNDKPLAKLKRSGSMEDAQEALLAMWRDD